MACVNPIIIKSPESRLLRKCRKENRSYEYYVAQSKQRRNLLYDPAPLIDNPHDYYNVKVVPERLMQVPCGKCELCQKARVDAYFIRNYFEFLHTTLACRGSAWFVTLTYSPDLLPKHSPLDVDEETGEIKGYLPPTPCFDKVHIQTFLKRLRKYTGFDMKYFIVTEFGGEFGRPHYHGILYINDFAATEQNRIKLVGEIARAWTKIEDRKKYFSMVEYGLFDVQRVDVQLLKDTKQIRYCCKYVTKQYGAVEFDKLHLDEQYKRFHLQSIGLGSHIFDYCNVNAWEKGYIELEGYKYAIPQYYKLQKMREFYCIHENGSIIYRPTNFKYQYMENFCKDAIDEHKSLALLNKDYPRLPFEFYSPLLLSLFLNAFSSYNFSRLIDLPFDVPEIVVKMFHQYQDFLLDVQRYNAARFAADAAKWQEQNKEHYLKKTHRK